VIHRHHFRKKLPGDRLQRRPGEKVFMSNVVIASTAPEGNRADYWRKRREWWAAEAKRTGTDWDGIQQTLREVAAFLAAMRKR
jgi:hypothetical protein